MNRAPARFSSLGRLLPVAVLLGTVAWSGAQGQTTSLQYDSFVETKALGSPLLPGGVIKLDGELRDGDLGAITNEFRFVAGSTSVSLAASWLIAPLSNRTIGVNIDLFDANNSVVGTDANVTVVDSVARSSATLGGLTIGASYRLVFTGTAAQAGRYSVALAAGTALPVLDPIVAVTPPANRAIFDTHFGSKSFGDILSNGDAWVIEGSMLDDANGAIFNTLSFASDADNISAGIEWIVGRPGDGVRATGVNVDLFDVASQIVATDVFQGVFDGQAFSQLALQNSADGQYRLGFTGIANQAGRYRIRLGTNPTAPGFEPIGSVTPIPEPETWLLFALGLTLIAKRSRLGARA